MCGRAGADRPVPLLRGAATIWSRSRRSPGAALFRPSSVARRWVTLSGVALAVAWTAGLVGFVASPGVFAVDVPRIEQPPQGRHNLAQVSLGPTVRASSFYADWSAHHHPLFLIDGRAQPQALEKWASSPRDRRPWVEILWREDRELDTVVVRHAGSVEDAGLTVRRYQITCLDAGGRRRLASALRVDDNSQTVATHPLHCAHSRGLRVDVWTEANDVARLYEIEAWGR